MILSGKGEGVACPECGCCDSEVKDSRRSMRTIRRRRICMGCMARFTTHEIGRVHRYNTDQVTSLIMSFSSLRESDRRFVVEMVNRLAGRVES